MLHVFSPPQIIVRAKESVRPLGVRKISKFSVYLRKCYCLGYRKNNKLRYPCLQSNGVFVQL